MSEETVKMEETVVETTQEKETVIEVEPLFEEYVDF